MWWKKSRLGLWWWILVAIATTSAFAATRVNLSVEHAVGERYMDMRLLGTVEIPDDHIGSIRVDEMSGLAWDEDEQLLYALSNRGKLFHLKPVFEDGKLVDTQVVAAFKLRNRYGKKLKKPYRDTEGLDTQYANNGKRGDSVLLISFEREPKIARFDNRGYEIERLPLPEPLNDADRYDTTNHGLEAVTAHPQLGIITAPEVPLRGSDGITLYSLDGKQWRIPEFPVADNAIVGMETMPDGDLLLLERAFSSMLSPIIISLHRITLDEACRTDTGRNGNTLCASRPVAIMSSSKGWDLDNFEGLARHQGNRYFIVSDNNRFWLQRTLLSYIEVLPPENTITRKATPGHRPQ